MKLIIALFLAFVAMASAFVPSASCRGALTASRTRSSTPLSAEEKEDDQKHVGSGGMADTRDPEPKDDPDPRKSISAAPSFEEYLKQKKESEAKK